MTVIPQKLWPCCSYVLYFYTWLSIITQNIALESVKWWGARAAERSTTTASVVGKLHPALFRSEMSGRNTPLLSARITLRSADWRQILRERKHLERVGKAPFAAVLFAPRESKTQKHIVKNCVNNANYCERHINNKPGMFVNVVEPWKLGLGSIRAGCCRSRGSAVAWGSWTDPWTARWFCCLALSASWDGSGQRKPANKVSPSFFKHSLPRRQSSCKKGEDLGTESCNTNYSCYFQKYYKSGKNFWAFFSIPKIKAQLGVFPSDTWVVSREFYLRSICTFIIDAHPCYQHNVRKVLGHLLPSPDMRADLDETSQTKISQKWNT